MHPSPPLKTMIAELIGLPSISSADPALDQSNLGVVHRLAEWAESIGFEVSIDPISEGKANLIAILNPFEDVFHPGGLVLSGHTDTVPCDPGLWQQDPFKAKERDGKLFGLGSCDMKSFLALAIEAAKGLDRKKLTAPLVLIGTADEESSMSGARQLLAQNRRLGRSALIGEPTGLKPIRMHKGMMMEAIRIHGRSGHSSDPRLGVNALDGMSRVLSALIAFRDELAAQHRNPAFEVETPTLNLGAIRGGDNPNRICGHCETLIDLRPLPGMDIDHLHQCLTERLEETLEAIPGLTLEVVRLFPGLPAFETPKDSPLVRACEDLSGHQAGAVAFGTEGPFFHDLGHDTLILGPGHIAQAHQPDEFLPLNQVPPMLAILEGLIQRHCLK